MQIEESAIWRVRSQMRTGTREALEHQCDPSVYCATDRGVFDPVYLAMWIVEYEIRNQMRQAG